MARTYESENVRPCPGSHLSFDNQYSSAPPTILTSPSAPSAGTEACCASGPCLGCFAGEPGMPKTERLARGHLILSYEQFLCRVPQDVQKADVCLTVNPLDPHESTRQPNTSNLLDAAALVAVPTPTPHRPATVRYSQVFQGPEVIENPVGQCGQPVVL